MTARLTPAQARRAALAAQGFGRRRPGTVSVRHVQAEIDRVAQFQIDSVNVVARAHLMPLFARLGPYDPALLERATSVAPRRLFEYWGHAACLLDVALYPAMRWQMRVRAERERRHVDRILADKPDLLDRVLADLAASGPLTARAVENTEQRRREHWGWNWSEAKYLLEYLFDAGIAGVAGRNPAFERRYDLIERVLPARVRAAPELDRDAGIDALVRRAARALGVADLTALSEYFYLRKADVALSAARLVAAGELERVEVAGLPGDHWLWAGARLPRTLHAQALVSPFDTLVFERKRLERLFGAQYRIEIYTPAAKRVYGYYVYLFVFGDRVAARVDLKADRRAGVLHALASWLEEDADADAVAAALASELHLLAGWQGLTDVAVHPTGTLAQRLARHV